MKKKTTISLVFYIIGIAVGFVLLFPFAGETQISNTLGIVSLAIATASLIYGLIILNVRGDKVSKTVTSKLTPFYKFYLPIIIIELLVFNTMLLVFNIYPCNDISVFVAIEVVLILWLLLLLPCFKLSQMYLQDGKIVVYNYIDEREFNEKEVKKVSRFFIFFFKVKLNKISFIILPKFSESANLFVTPKSIQILKNLI